MPAVDLHAHSLEAAPEASNITLGLKLDATPLHSAAAAPVRSREHYSWAAAMLAGSRAAALVASGDTNLKGTPLQSCTQSGDSTPTGVDRSGSCSWDAADTGYHEVCVTMSAEFLKNSAKSDDNDLSSVVSAGGHWCICAWAWASAVERDPTNKEGLALDCDRTNGRLRSVYKTNSELTGPTGNSYESDTALAAVDALCGNATAVA